MLEAPGASIPQQMKSPAGTKAAYRFLSNEGYQYEELIGLQWVHVGDRGRDIYSFFEACQQVFTCA